MKAIMIGYWVILVGLVFDVVGTVWDAIGDLTGEEALGGLQPRKIEVPGNSHSNIGSRLRVTDRVEKPRVKSPMVLGIASCHDTTYTENRA
jgi:hypothetical protein